MKYVTTACSRMSLPHEEDKDRATLVCSWNGHQIIPSLFVIGDLCFRLLIYHLAARSTLLLRDRQAPEIARIHILAPICDFAY